MSPEPWVGRLRTLIWGSKSKKCEVINNLEANNILVAMVKETHFQPATNFICQIT